MFENLPLVSVDPIALVAFGFLAPVVLVSVGLSAFVMRQAGKKHGAP